MWLWDTAPAGAPTDPSVLFFQTPVFMLSVLFLLPPLIFHPPKSKSAVNKQIIRLGEGVGLLAADTTISLRPCTIDAPKRVF